MRFAPSQAQLDCADLAGGTAWRRAEAADRIAAAAAEVLERLGFVALRIGRLRLSVADSRSMARDLAERLRCRLIAGGAPGGLRMEADQPQDTYIPPGHPTRTLLPHFDGQHCSYLTPSQLDVPEFDPRWREFGHTGYTTTPSHKMYQGIFVSDPGAGLSVTTYYDWLAILRAVRAGRGLAEAGEPISEVARWLGSNLRRAQAAQPEHSCPYPSIGAMLGLAEPSWHGISFHYGESELSSAERARFPEAARLARSCQCRGCMGEVARLFCHQLLTATGLTWSGFRERWEVLLPGEHCDLLVGHNLTMLHGGWAGGPGRTLEPLCLVVDDPRGPEYERWLASSWRREASAG